MSGTEAGDKREQINLAALSVEQLVQIKQEFEQVSEKLFIYKMYI